MRILITGSAGYLGHAVASYLIENGHEVVGIDNELFQTCVLGPAPQAAFHQKKGDIRDLAAHDFANVNAVIHLAGLSNDQLVRLSPHITYEVNIQGALNVALCARSAGVSRFVFASSCEVYGSSAVAGVDEDAPIHPDTPYAESKAFVEAELVKLASQDFCPVSLRLPDAYGFSPRMRFDLFVNNLAGQAASTGRIELKLPATEQVPILHVEDAAQAFGLAAVAPSYQVWSEAFNVGSENSVLRAHDIAQVVSAQFGGASIEFAPDARTKSAPCRPSFDKLCERLPDFKPSWSLEQGVIQMREAFFTSKVTAVDMEGPRFDRLEHLRWLFDDGSLSENLRWTSTSSMTA